MSSPRSQTPRSPTSVLVIVGPTAAGKSQVALHLAQHLPLRLGLAGAEILLADAFKIYRGMDIGTDKPSLQAQQRIPHHLIDLVDPDQPYSVALYKKEAEKALKEVLARGNLPIVEGGTGLYVKALVQGFQIPPAGADTGLREALRRRAEAEGPDALYEELCRVDAVAAAEIHPHNVKRVLRALEVYHLTGTPISQLRHIDHQEGSRYTFAIIGLTLPRPVLYERIERRVEAMMERGLVEEVRSLVNRLGLSEKHLSMQAIGYRQLLPVLDGTVALEDAVESIKQATRQFAKRQMTWFRRLDGVHWLELSEEEDLARVEGLAIRLLTGR